MFDVHETCAECDREVGFEYDDWMRLRHAVEDAEGFVFLCPDCEAKLEPVWHRDR